MVSRDEVLSRNKPYPIDAADRARANVPAGASALWTGEIRRPNAGEWYLKAGDGTGDRPAVTAHCAEASLTAEHAIAMLRMPPDRPGIKANEQTKVLADLVDLI